MKNYTKFLWILCLSFFGIYNLSYAQGTLSPVILGDQVLGGSGHDEPRSFALLPDGTRVLGGFSSSNIGFEKSENSRGGLDYWLLKTDNQGNKLWDKTFGGTGTDYLNVVLSLPDGGFLLGGYSDSDISGEKSQSSRGSFDFWIIRTNAQGNKIWDKTFGGSGREVLNTMNLLPDGHVLLGGYSQSFTSGEKSEPSRGDYDYWVVKIDLDGNKIWDKTIGGFGYDALNNSAQLPNGNVVLAGLSYSGISGEKTEPSRGFADFWLIQINFSNGAIVWQKTLGGNNEDYQNGIVAAPDGNGFLVSGASLSNASAEKSENKRGDWDYWIIRIDNQGNKIWDKTFGGTDADLQYRLLALKDNNFLVSGHSYSNTSFEKTENSRGLNDFWVLKVDQNGNLLWNKTLGGDRSDKLTALVQLTDGSILLSGYSTSGISGEKTAPHRGNGDYWLYRFSDNSSDEKLAAILVDAITDKPLREIHAGDTINVFQLGNDFLTFELRERVKGEFESVDIKLEGPIHFQQTENLLPYMLFGENAPGDFRGKHFSPGQYTLTATPYSEDQLQGIKGDTLTIPFTVIGEVPSPVVRFVLVNADTEQDINVLNPGDIIDMDQVGTNRLSIRAETQGNKVGSVFMELTSLQLNHTQIENLIPYAIFGGEPRTNYYGREFCPGNYTIKATPYLNANKTGNLGRSLTLNFQLKGSKLSVENFTLVNPGSDEDIRLLEDNAKIQVPSEGIAIRANAGSCVESVFFNLKNNSGQLLFTRLENIPPYAFVGDDTYGDYFSWKPQPGIYTLEAIPYSEDNAKGVVGLAKTIRFEILAPGATAALDESASVTLYPNPSSQDQVHLSLDKSLQGTAQLVVRDKQGNVILNKTIHTQEIDLNTQTLKPGYYIIELQTAEGIIRKPLIKN